MGTITLLMTLLFAQQESASIEGFVLRAGTSQPVTRARVVLTRADGPGGGPVTAVTGGDGRFVLRNVPPGRYRLFASRDGYVRAEFGQRGASRPGTLLTLQARQEMKDVRLDMTPTGAIAGRITDRYGEPVGNAIVQALKYTYQDGRRVLNVMQTARTNDLGEYRLFWMQPGQYIVSAVPSETMRFDGGSAVIEVGPGSPISIAGGGAVSGVVNAIRVGGASAAAQGMVGAAETGETYLTVYYPGTTDATTAASIDLRPGINFTGVDLIVADTRAVRVRGRVISGSTNQPMGGTMIMLVPRGTAISGPVGQRTAQTNNNGEFEIRGVAPGSYELVATAGQRFSFSFGPFEGTGSSENVFVTTTPPPPPPGSGAPAPPLQSGRGAAPEGRFGGRVPIEVGSADVENVTIALQQAFNIRARVIVEGGSQGANVGSIQLRPEPFIPQLSPSPGRMGPDGTLMITGVLPGEYRVMVVGVPRTHYLKAAQFNSVDALNGLLRIDGDPRTTLDVLISPNPGTFEAMIVNDRGESVQGAVVVLAPDPSRRNRSELYRTANSDASGRIRIEGIVPGDYKIFAWEDVESGVWQDPEFMRAHEDRGKAVHISEGGRENTEVRIIPNR